MKSEQEHSSYKPSEKKGPKNVRGEYNKEDYLKNLEKAMENEAKNPSQSGNNKKVNPMGPRGQYDKNEYLQNLEKAMEAEEQHSGYYGKRGL